MGTLGFGSHPSTFTGVLKANATSGGAVVGATQIVCSPDVEATRVIVNGGNNAGQGGYMGLPLPGTGAAINLPVYARINKSNARRMAEGTYVDTLQVTLSW